MSRCEPRVALTCDLCGNPFEITKRWAREINARGLVRRCGLCERPPKEPETISDSDRLYWLTSYSDEELAEIASASFGVIVTAEAFATRRAELVPPALELAATA